MKQSKRGMFSLQDAMYAREEAVVVGIVVGVTFAVIALVALLYFRSHRDRREHERDQADASQRLRLLHSLSIHEGNVTHLNARVLGGSTGTACASPLTARLLTHSQHTAAVAAVKGEAAAATERHTERQRRIGWRRCICGLLVVVVIVAVVVLSLMYAKESSLAVGARGFQWTERYGQIVHCNGVSILITRMRYFGPGKYVPVLRFEGDDDATVLWDRYDLGYNTAGACIDDELWLIGSANVEWTLVSSPEPGRVVLYNYDQDQLVTPTVPAAIEAFFPVASFDSKFSVALLNETWHIYIRANTQSAGGGRFVQHATSTDNLRTWSEFQLLEIEGVTPAHGNDLYWFSAIPHPNTTGLLANFPAVFMAREWSSEPTSGLFETESTDGIHWSAPRLVRYAQRYGERTTLHPVGGELGAQRINLHLDTYTVTLYILGADGQLSVDDRFKTKRLL